MTVLQYGILALGFFKAAQMLEPAEGQSLEDAFYAISVLSFLIGAVLLMFGVADMLS